MLVNANEFQKVKKYTPILTDNYKFPVREIPMYGSFDYNGASSIPALIEAPDCKGILRTDTNQIISVVSNKYKLVPHSDVIDGMEEEIKKEYDYERKIYLTHDGARIYAEFTIKNLNMDVGEGDPVCLRLIARNSYDGSTIMGISLEGLRLLCLNGLMGFGSIFNFGKKHMGDIMINDNVGQKLHDAVSTYKDSLIPYWKNLSQKDLNMDAGIVMIKDTIEKKIIPEKYEEDILNQWNTKASQFNAWYLYNCYTFVLTHIVKKISYDNYMNMSRKVSGYFRLRYQN